MQGSRWLLLFLFGLLVGGALGAFVIAPRWSGDDTRAEHAAAPEARPEVREPLAGTGAPAPDARLEPAPESHEAVEDLRRQNEALVGERDELVGELEELKQRLEDLEPAPRDPRAFRFGVPERAPSFDEADWSEMADLAQNLAEELHELPEIIARGEQPSQAKISRIVKYNSPLASFAVAFGNDTKDATPNGAFTHPAVIANLIRASLMGTDMPLTSDQEIALATLGDAWSAETARIESGIAPDAPAMKRTVAEVDAKLRFLDAAKNVLTAEQRAVLFPPESAGRLKLDLLSPVLVYVLAQPVRSPTRPEMETKLIESMLAHAGIEEPDVGPYAWIGRQWVDDIPGVTTPISESSKDLVFPHVDAVQAKARAQVAAAERLLAMGNLTAEQADAIRSMQTLLYPYVPVQ